VVRVSPNVLSIIEPDAWKDAYGYKSPSFAKDVKGTLGPDPLGSPPGLLRADDINHARQRRLVSHAFSDRALKEQEPILKSYARTLVAKLTEIATEKQEAGVNLIDWYNFTTFDIMVNLSLFIRMYNTY
jgi:cytochrome P450